MLGMADIFTGDFDNIFHTIGLGHVAGYARIVYIVYIVLTTIILLNLLIAMMTDSYAEVKAREGTTWRVGSIRLAIQLERAMPFIPKFFILVGIKNNPVKFDNDSGHWLMHIPRSEINLHKHQLQTETTKALNRLEKGLNQLRTHLGELHEKVDTLSSTIESSNTVQSRTPGLLNIMRNRKISNLAHMYRAK